MGEHLHWLKMEKNKNKKKKNKNMYKSKKAPLREGPNKKRVVKIGPFSVELWSILINMVKFSKQILYNFLVEIHQVSK